MNNELVFRISAIDNASKVAGKVRGEFARVSDPISKLIQNFTGMSKQGVAALGSIDRNLHTVAQSARTVSDRITSIIPGMAALTGLASTTSIGVLAQRWGNLGFNLQRTSRELGLSTQGLQAWHYAAQRAGVTTEQLDQSMLSSQNTIREAAFGANPQAMMLLSRLGVQISRTQNGQIDYSRTQNSILTALGKIKNTVGQRTAADTLGMGALLPMIQRGTYHTDRQQAIINGYVPSENAIQRAAAFRDHINALTSGASALANTIGDKLVPVLTPMIEKLSAWLNENRIDIATRLADAVGKFTNWITSVDWGGWYNRINRIADAFGGWGSVLRDIVAIKFATTLFSWTSAIVSLAGSLVTAKTAAEALKNVANVGSGIAAVGAGAAASNIPWLARLFNPYVAGTTALFYSKNLNSGEDEVLANAQMANGKRYLTPAESAPGGMNDPKILAIIQKFQEMGWSKPQATGMAVNILQKSGGNPYRVSDSGAYGIGQWQSDSQTDFKRVFGHDIRQSTLEEQLNFFDWELRKGPRMQRTQLTAEVASTDQAGFTSEGAKPQDSHEKLVDALSTAVQKTPVHVTVTAPPGTRVETATSDGASLPTRINYSMSLGAMP